MIAQRRITAIFWLQRSNHFEGIRQKLQVIGYITRKNNQVRFERLGARYYRFEITKIPVNAQVRIGKVEYLQSIQLTRQVIKPGGQTIDSCVFEGAGDPGAPGRDGHYRKYGRGTSQKSSPTVRTTSGGRR